MGLIQYGNVVLASLYPAKGKEVSKLRPAVVVSCNLISSESPYIILVPISSRLERVFDFQLCVKPSNVNGLKVDSKLMPEAIRSVDKIRIVKKIGQLEEKYMEHLEGKLLYVLNQNTVP